MKKNTKTAAKNSKKNTIKIVISIAFIMIGIGLTGAFLVAKRIVTLNHPTEKNYPVTGIDVSHYQGKINWDTIESQNVDFAFIKATEGSSYVDENFESNWTNAQNSKIKIGAYHFFSFDSSAKTQAYNYITAVGNLKGKLPPVIDFEYYGDKEKDPPDVEQTREELQKMLDILETYYGVKPIIYTTQKVYYKYIKHEFDDYALWIRNVYYSPDIDLKGKWKFWQYTDKAVLDGYSGDEKYIDRNVFNGTEAEFLKLIN